MITYGNTTFCMSPNCTNKCGRQMPKEVKEEAYKSGLPVCWGYYCGEPKDDLQGSTKKK
jgi:hypothetical protein